MTIQYQQHYENIKRKIQNGKIEALYSSHSC